tara:strand:- start:799 stop:1302 length:504 start_codon:yes stop_codon:yes gene_type:complete
MSQIKLRNGLTRKQENFAQGVASGLTLSDAYRAAYDINGDKPETVQHNASLLASNTTVASRIEELNERLAVLADINLASVAAEMDDARVTAKHAEVPQVASMIAASRAKANLVGILTPQLEVKQRSLTIEATLDELNIDDLRQLLALGDTAKALEAGDGSIPPDAPG